MKFNFSCLPCAVLAIGVLAGCTTVRPGPHLSSVEAVRIADAEVRRTRGKAQELSAGKAHYSSERHCWVVTYFDKHSGGGFEMEVDDVTKKPRLATYIDVWPAH